MMLDSIDCDNYPSAGFEMNTRNPIEKNIMDMLASRGGARSKEGVGLVMKKWDLMVLQLLKFKKKHGHCLVPNRYSEDPQLGSWVSTQRRQFKVWKENRSPPMTKERVDYLESIGFVWATKDPRHVPWERRFNELIDYHKEHGDCLVPIGYKQNPQLSNWVSTQRQEYKLLLGGRSSRISQERIDKLNEIGFVWEAHRGGKSKQYKKRARAADTTNITRNKPRSSERETFMPCKKHHAISTNSLVTSCFSENIQQQEFNGAALRYPLQANHEYLRLIHDNSNQKAFSGADDSKHTLHYGFHESDTVADHSMQAALTLFSLSKSSGLPPKNEPCPVETVQSSHIKPRFF